MFVSVNTKYKYETIFLKVLNLYQKVQVLPWKDTKFLNAVKK